MKREWGSSLSYLVINQLLCDSWAFHFIAYICHLINHNRAMFKSQHDSVTSFK